MVSHDRRLGSRGAAGLAQCRIGYGAPGERRFGLRQAPRRLSRGADRDASLAQDATFGMDRNRQP